MINGNFRNSQYGTDSLWDGTFSLVIVCKSTHESIYALQYECNVFRILVHLLEICRYLSGNSFDQRVFITCPSKVVVLISFFLKTLLVLISEASHFFVHPLPLFTLMFRGPGILLS